MPASSSDGRHEKKRGRSLPLVVSGRRRLTGAVAGAVLLAVGCGGDGDDPVVDSGPGRDRTTLDGGAARDRGSVPAARAVLDQLLSETSAGPVAGYRELVGHVEGTDAYLGAMVWEAADGSVQSLGYVCDGAALATLLIGGEDDGRLGLRSDDGTATVVIDGSNLTGTALLHGERHAVALEEVDPSGRAGLYFSAASIDDLFSSTDYGGWILLPDGSQRGAIRTGDMLQPGGTLDPATGDVAAPGATIESRNVDDNFRVEIDGFRVEIDGFRVEIDG